MASMNKELLGKVAKIVPPMLERFHKGESIAMFLSRATS